MKTRVTGSGFERAQRALFPQLLKRLDLVSVRWKSCSFSSREEPSEARVAPPPTAGCDPNNAGKPLAWVCLLFQDSASPTCLEETSSRKRGTDSNEQLATFLPRTHYSAPYALAPPTFPEPAAQRVTIGVLFGCG